MSVPETSMHEYDGVPAGQHDVRPPWQRPFVQSESQTGTMQVRTNEALRFRILSAYAGHHPTARGSPDDVHHCSAGGQSERKLIFAGKTGTSTLAAKIWHETLGDGFNHRNSHSIAELPICLGI
jgi:hypothetical protein